MQRVLVVDDEQLVADTLTLVFGKRGFDPGAPSPAHHGLERAREFKPDLLLCDVTMPGRDGLDLVKDITREMPDCRILILTGFYSNLKVVRDAAQLLSVSLPVMTKPCQPEDLLREAAAVLARA